MAGIQLVGNTNNTTAVEVEANTKAMRAVIRPDDYGSLGMYSIGATSGTMAAGLAGGSPIFSFRNPTGSTAIVLVKRILLSAVGGSTGFTAGTGLISLFAARSFTASDTGGTDITPAAAANTGKLRTSMATTQTVGTGDIRISSTATLTAGTRTLDAQALASIATVCSATANTVMIPQATELWYQRAGEYPIVLAASEGFVIQATVTATGTWAFSVSVHWQELASY